MPPFFTRLTIFVFSPIAPIAIAIKNLASFFIAGVKYEEYAAENELAPRLVTTVVMTKAAIK